MTISLCALPDCTGSRTVAVATPSVDGGTQAAQDAGSPPASVDPSSYPSIEEKELGQLRWVLALANQEPGDFTNFEAQNQNNLTSYRYQIAFSVYFLAVEQYHKLPAWSGALKPAIDRLIHKLLLMPVWEYCAETSKGVPNLEPAMDQPYPASHDPVGEKNIMYSGHVGHTVSLYEALYRDRAWDQPGAITFAWSADEQFIYDPASLEIVMQRQMAGNLYHSICCEPNAVFPECNQPPVLRFVLSDAVHGTKLSDVNALFFDFFRKNGMIDPATHEVAMLYLVEQGWTVSENNPKYGNTNDPALQAAVKSGVATLDSATADGWTGAFMHVWQPQFVEQLYPYWKKNRMTRDKNEGWVLKWESWEPMVQYGFFATLAAELGDADVRDKMLAYAERHYQPVWLDGTYHYPANYDASVGCTNLTDKLLALARALPKNGLRELHAAPFDDAHFTEPELAGIDTDKMFPLRAIYDRKNRVLVVSTAPVAADAAPSAVALDRLDAKKSYRLTVDGRERQTIAGAASASFDLDPSVPHDIALYEN